MNYYGNEYYPDPSYYHYPHNGYPHDSYSDPNAMWGWGYLGYEEPPQRNIHVNPAFYQVPGPTTSASGKVIVNPKFFSVATNVQTTKTPMKEESKPEKPVTSKNVVVVNKKYLWKKIEAGAKVLPARKYQNLPSKRHVFKSALKSPAKLRRFSKSRYRVDKRVMAKPKLNLNTSKVVNTKYKIIRQASVSETRKHTSRFLTPRTNLSLNKFKLFARNKWRPLSTATTKQVRNVPEKKIKVNKNRKKQDKPVPTKRYYDSRHVDRNEQQEPSEEYEFEVSDRQPALRQREPLGKLPSFITLS